MTEDRRDSTSKASETDSSSIQEGCFGLAGKNCVKSGGGGSHYHPLTGSEDDSRQNTYCVPPSVKNDSSYMKLQDSQLTAGLESISITEHQPEPEEVESTAAAMPKKTKAVKKSAGASTAGASASASDGWHPTEFRLAPAGVNEDMVISGHLDLNTLYASNDVTTGPITVNVCNAPNNSTDQCGCENINCPFCNLLMSIEKTDPNVLPTRQFTYRGSTKKKSKHHGIFHKHHKQQT